MARITVIGGGYVGLVTSACFAELGHHVRCLESDPGKVSMLKAGTMPIQEPGLAEIWQSQAAAGNLTVTDSPAEALSSTEFVYIAVGTPESPDGSANLEYVEAAVDTAVKYSDLSRTICVKSTVPPGTCAGIQQRIRATAGVESGWTVVSNPEFLSQGRAVEDFLNPDRVVVGSSDERVSWSVAALYAPLDPKTVIVDSTASELVKYASNSFLALKISFINEISRLCEYSGTDVGQVAAGVGMDSRIGEKFLQAGLGWGGSCFPKDTAALEKFMQSVGAGSDIVSAARTVNAGQVSHVVGRVKEMVPVGDGASVAVLGLTFKDGTDDLRGSQAIPLIQQLLADGYSVRAYDPVQPQISEELASKVTVCASAEEALFGAAAAVLTTAWPELVSLDYAELGKSMRSQVLVDTRRVLDPQAMVEFGFDFYRPGDGRVHTAQFAGEVPAEQGSAPVEAEMLPQPMAAAG